MHLIYFLLVSLGEVLTRCLNNYEYDIFKSRTKWYENGNWKIQGTINPTLEEGLKNWRLEMQFTAPLAEDFYSWMVNGGYNTSGKTSVVLTPKIYMNDIDVNFEMTYIATFKTPQMDHVKCAQFCGTLVNSNKALCSTLEKKKIAIPSSIKKCLNNYQYDSLRSSDEWNDNGRWRTNGVITPSLKEEIKDWYIEMEFTAPLSEEIQVWNVKGVNKTEGESLIRLIPKEYNGRLSLGKFELSYIASFDSPQGNKYISCVQFCGTLKNSNHKLCSDDPLNTTVSPSLPECLMNYKYAQPPLEVFSNGTWKTNGTVTPSFEGELINWHLLMQFNVPLKDDIQAKNVIGTDNTAGRKSVMLKPMDSNQKISGKTFELPFIVTFADQQRNKHFRCIQFCGMLLETNESLCITPTPKPVITRPSSIPNCLNNYIYDDTLSSREWNDNGKWRTKGFIKPSFEGELENWYIKIEFTAPLLEDIQAWAVDGVEETRGREVIILQSKSYNKKINKRDFVLTFLVTFGSAQRNDYIRCLQFCGTFSRSKLRLCSS